MKVGLLKGIHWVSKFVLERSGYRWELRRNGDSVLGLWKKTFRQRNQRQPFPKRIVFIPGFGDTPLSWYGVVSLLFPVLKLHYDEVILLDFPGFGGFLSRERAFPSMDLMMASVSDVLDALKPHTILGHSLGGWLTAHYAACCGAGERPQSNPATYQGPQLILLANPSGLFPNEESKKDWEFKFKTAMEEGFQILRPHLFAKEPAWFGWVHSEFSGFLEKEDVLQFMRSVREEHLVSNKIQKIRSRVSILWGELDTLIPPTCAEAWMSGLASSEYASAELILLKQSGHSPQVEQPAAVAAAIGQILMNRSPHRLGHRWWKVVKSDSNRITHEK